MEVYKPENDISETHDVADQYPGLVKKMNDMVYYSSAMTRKSAIIPNTSP